MKKKRKVLLEKINQDKVRLEKNLKTFLAGLPEKEKKGYEAYANLLQVLRGWTTVEIPMEMDFTIITNFGFSKRVRLDSNRKISVGLTLLYAFINNELYDEAKAKKMKEVPEELMDEITDFKMTLKEFLFF